MIAVTGWNVLRRAWQASSQGVERIEAAMETAPGGATPASCGLAFSELELRTRDGLWLSAWWIPGPASAGAGGVEADGFARAQRATAVVHHFYGGGKAAVLPWVKLLHDLGLDVIALDGRGHGGSAAPPPGSGENFGARASDVQAACDEARARGTEQLVLVGQSQGGGLPVLLAASRRADVAGVIVESGPAATMLGAGLGLAKFALAGVRPPNPRLTLALCTARISLRGRPVTDTLALWRALIALRARPLLWIHGERDSVIPIRSARRWFRILRQPEGPWWALTVQRGRHAACVPLGETEVRNTVRLFLRDTCALLGPNPRLALA